MEEALFLRASKSLDSEETKYSIKAELTATELPQCDFHDSLIDSTDETSDSNLIQKIPIMCFAPTMKKPEDLSQSLWNAAKSNNADLCRSILEKSGHQIDVNYKGQEEMSCLSLACKEGFFKVCENLIDYGQDTHINIRNSQMQTPLHLACAAGHLKIAQLLVRSGADINAIDLKGNTSIHLACFHSHSAVINWLLTRGPNLTIRNMDEKLAEDLCSPINLVLFHKHLKRTVSLPGPSISSNLKYIAKQFTIQEVNEKDGKVNCFDFAGICELGHGSFGDVYLVNKKNTGKLFAMKVLRKERIMERNLIKYAVTERNVLTYIKHPFIVPLKYAFQTPSKLFLILEYCAGGDLSTHLMREKRFSEQRAKIYLCEIVLALEELHKQDIIYRDLKPDNIVIDKDGHVLLTDFGLSKEGIFDNHAAKSFCGSLAYLAPEMIRRKGHGKAVDWYLLGVVFFEMVVGVPPYFSPNKDELISNIQNSKLKIPSFLSSEAKELIKDVRFK
jgi:protein-serine/threonine kinase